MVLLGFWSCTKQCYISMYSYQPLCASQKEITKSQSSRAVVQKNYLENFGKSPGRFPKLHLLVQSQ